MVGIFGQHSPGIANKYIRNSSIVICLGISLLQHQTGKVQNNFAPRAKIVFVNNNLNECKRAKKQFGKRLIYFNCEISDFLSCFNKSYISNLFYKKDQYYGWHADQASTPYTNVASKNINGKTRKLSLTVV